MNAELARRLVTLELCDLFDPVSSHHWRAICQLQSLTALKVSTWDESVGGIETMTGESQMTSDVISQLTNLVDLRLRWSCLAPQSCDGLQHLGLLTNLHMFGAVPSGYFCLISGLTSLNRLLVLPENPLTIPMSLSGLLSLREVILDHATLTGWVQAIGDLASLQHLECAELAFEPASGAAYFFNALSKLTELTFLDLSFDITHDAMDSSVIDPLSKLVQLRFADVSFANFKPSGNWPALTSLSLIRNELTEPPYLAGLPSLQVCELRQSQAFQIRQPLTYVTSMPSLRMLDLQQSCQAPWSVQSFVHLAEVLHRVACLSRTPPLVIRA